MIDKNFLDFFSKDNTSDSVYYNGTYFVKNIENDMIFIYLGSNKKEVSFNDLVYIINNENRLLYVFNCLYCSYLHDSYWRLDESLGLKEIIIDPTTLIRVSNLNPLSIDFDKKIDKKELYSFLKQTALQFS